MQEKPAFIKWFRSSSPYINAHRGKTAVVYMPGEVVENNTLRSIAHDLTLMRALGMKIVLVHGAQPQIDRQLQANGMDVDRGESAPIIDAAALECIRQAVGAVRFAIEAEFSTGLASTPMWGADVTVVSGNLVTARPYGVRNGVDHQHSGEVRRLDVPSIAANLERGALVMLSPLGFSPTGETFYLDAEEVACAAAIELRADKLLFLSTGQALSDAQGAAVGELDPAQAQAMAQSGWCQPAHRRQLALSARACRAGVRRAHIVPGDLDGALLQELYTRDGVGTLITADDYDILRQASIDDVGGILALISPLEADGTLVQRSREQLELEIGNFTVMERDGLVVACAALYPFIEDRVAELACVVVHPDYRNHDRGERLLRHMERRARDLGIERIFVLTTRTAHWFIERDYQPGRITDLPVKRRLLYNYQRNSKVFIKPLTPERSHAIGG